MGCREPKYVPYPLKLLSNILNTYPCLETLKSYYSHAWKSRFSHHRRILSSNSFFSRQKYLPPPFIFFRGRPQTMLTRICPSLTTYSHFTLVRKYKQTVDISNTTYLPKSPCQRSLWTTPRQRSSSPAPFWGLFSVIFSIFDDIGKRWKYIQSFSKVPSMSFYPDFILILSKVYFDCIQTLSRFYPDFIQILFWFYLDKIRIKFG